MGPGRGKLLHHFDRLCCLEEKVKFLYSARGGGSISPEVLQILLSTANVEVQENTEIVDVKQNCKGDSFLVWTINRECEHFGPQKYDKIWICTGFDNSIANVNALKKLQTILPIHIENGLPELNHDLSWRAPTSTTEPAWKSIARKGFFTMGPLAGLQVKWECGRKR